MVEVRIEKKPEIKIIGRKIWISGTDNELFSQFWEESKENGFLDLLYKLRQQKRHPLLNSAVFGVSCVEKDPSIREFYFYIATEYEDALQDPGLEEYTIPATEWAVFENSGAMPFALVVAEMYAFMTWLPDSEYLHNNAPELELYPPCNDKEGTRVEFWLPIKKKLCNN